MIEIKAVVEQEGDAPLYIPQIRFIEVKGVSHD
jgi:hypothetical protein